ncbi:hypothetical protein [Rhizobium sp. Leaf386]|uniref:hypothetical protein n=1 Tax=Rhizobium sp. Leaf386 TaxID=1736359 RepID=UPI0007147066|nr:hypothetical protein [Rhizobium sp. Leaf386]KQS90295.1 hypothetical protein ASG50_07510 [Rhizobium sp. Leaf386]
MKRIFGPDGQVFGVRRYRMPQIIGMAFINLLTTTGALAGVVGALGFAGTAALALGIGYAATLGGLYLLSGFMQKKPATPQPSDVQTNIRQEIMPRRRVYGTYLIGSVVVFGFRRGEKSYILHYVCEGPINDYLSFRMDKRPITVDDDGFVTDAQYIVDGRSRVQILTTLGTMTDGPFAELIAAFPELDTPMTPFRHRGCAMALQIVEQVPQEKLADVYPNNMPALQFLIEGWAQVYDPRSETHGFSDNAGTCLLTEVMDVYGLTQDDEEEIDFSAFASFGNHCDETIPLKAGGVEKRYRCAGPITLDSENEERIKAVMSICNADVYIDARGRFSVRPRMRSTPSFALRARNGDHLDIQIEGGRGLQKLFNVAKVNYVDPTLNYKANEITWRHVGLIDEDGGEFTTPIKALLCPSATQAQRIGKLAIFENNPDFTGTLASGPQALELLDDYVFTLDLSPEDNFERVAAAPGAIQYDPETMQVSTSFTVFADGATDWNGVIDEQRQVVVPPELPSNVDDIPLDVTVTVELQNNSAPILKFSWTGAGATVVPDSYRHDVEVSPADAEIWSAAAVTQAEDTARFAAVADGGAYDWRIRNVASGRTFDWQYSTAPVTVTVDPVAPAALTTFSASDGTGQFTANFGTTNDAHLFAVAIYRVPAGGVLDPDDHLFGPYVVAPGISYSLPVTSVAGSYDIYVRPFNRSNVAGPLSGPDGAIVS